MLLNVNDPLLEYRILENYKHNWLPEQTVLKSTSGHYTRSQGTESHHQCSVLFVLIHVKIKLIRRFLHLCIQSEISKMTWIHKMFAQLRSRTCTHRLICKRKKKGKTICGKSAIGGLMANVIIFSVLLVFPLAQLRLTSHRDMNFIISCIGLIGGHM